MSRRSVKQLVAEANSVIESISVAEGMALVGNSNVVFVDVREPAEIERDGGITGAVHVPRGFLEFHADPDFPLYNAALNPDKRLVLYCASGGRSALAAKTLNEMGYDKVCYVAGGFMAWKQAHGPSES